jgi:2'-5' RNA ligase
MRTTIESKKVYAVFLTFSGKIGQVLGRLRADYQPDIDDAILPHVTLVYSFVPVFSLFKVLEQLDAVAKRTPPFKINLNGIRFFEGSRNVAYAAIENKKDLKALHADIVKSLEGLIKPWHTRSTYLERFTPHVTIWNRIPPNVFPEVRKRLSRYTLRYQEEITDFSLFVEENDEWELSRVFKLIGTEVENSRGFTK